MEIPNHDSTVELSPRVSNSADTHKLAPAAVSRRMSLGGNNFGRKNTLTETLSGVRAVINEATSHGIVRIDTADVYGAEPGVSERLIGEAVRGRRDEFVITTKFGHSHFNAGLNDAGPKGSPEYIRRAVDASLRRLRTEWIDVYQLHTPDPLTPVGETLGALAALIEAGKVRTIGHSNFPAWFAVHADSEARRLGYPRFTVAQTPYNLIDRSAEAEMLPALRAFNIEIEPYFPLHNGLLTGKYRAGLSPKGSRLSTARPDILTSAPWQKLERFENFCTLRGISMLAGSWGWLFAQPGLTHIPAGVTSPDQVRANVLAGQAWAPSADDLVEIDGIFPPVKSSVAPFATPLPTAVAVEPARS